MRWFQHQTDAHRDTKIKKLINDFGADGYAVYFYCLELIAGDLDSDNITFELEDDAQLIGQYLKVDTLRVEAIMRKCLELELFGINENGHVACLKIAKFISEDFTRSPKLKRIIHVAKKNKLSADSRQTVGRLSANVSATIPNLTVPNPINNIYNDYPSRDVNNNNRSTGKSRTRDLEKISKLISSGRYTPETLAAAQKAYLEECARTGAWIKDYKTFLNNIPEVEEPQAKPATDPKEEKAVLLRSIRRGEVPQEEIDAALKAGVITQGEIDAR